MILLEKSSELRLNSASAINLMMVSSISLRGLKEMIPMIRIKVQQILVVEGSKTISGTLNSNLTANSVMCFVFSRKSAGSNVAIIVLTESVTQIGIAIMKRLWF